MLNLRYDLSKLRMDYCLRDIRERYSANQKIPPSYVLRDCSWRCNLKCSHYGATKDTDSSELTTEQIKDILDELSMMKVEMFAVTGGEPLLQGDSL